MGNVRLALPSRSLFLVATVAAITTVAVTGARTPTALKKSKHPDVARGSGNELLGQLSSNRTAVIEVASVRGILDGHRVMGNHSQEHAHSVTGELEVGGVDGLQTRLKDQQEVLVGDNTPSYASKSDIDSPRAVNTGPATALLVQKVNRTAEDLVAVGATATSSDSNRLGARMCCQCFEAKWDNGEQWRLARNFKSGAVFSKQYGPVLCHAQADNKACYNKKRLILAWKPSDVASLEGCEALITGCAGRLFTGEDEKRLWPSELKECLEADGAEHIKAYCSQAKLQAGKNWPIGNVDDDSRTCLAIEKPESKNVDDRPPKPTKPPFVWKSSTPAATGWTVAWALPVFLAVHTTAGAVRFSY